MNHAQDLFARRASAVASINLALDELAGHDLFCDSQNADMGRGADGPCGCSRAVASAHLRAALATLAGDEP